MSRTDLLIDLATDALEQKRAELDRVPNLESVTLHMDRRRGDQKYQVKVVTKELIEACVR